VAFSFQLKDGSTFYYNFEFKYGEKNEAENEIENIVKDGKYKIFMD